MADIGHCIPMPSYTIHFVKACWFAGLILASICYGILIMLGYNCLVALRKRNPREKLIKSRLSVYVLLTLTVATVAEVLDIKVTMDGVLDQVCQGNHVQPNNPYLGRVDIAFLIINYLTDGLLVWRCWAIASGFSGRKWLVAWIVPLAVYVVMIVTGVILVVIFSISPKRGGIGDKLIIVQFGTSLLLNSLISLIIVVFILYYRRLLAQCDSSLARPYLNVVTIIVESAVLTVFIDVFAIVAIPLIPVGGVAFQLWVQVQPIASLLITYRVSSGTDYFNQKEEVASTLKFQTIPPASQSESLGEIEAPSAGHDATIFEDK